MIQAITNINNVKQTVDSINFIAQSCENIFNVKLTSKDVVHISSFTNGVKDELYIEFYVNCTDDTIAWRIYNNNKEFIFSDWSYDATVELQYILTNIIVVDNVIDISIISKDMFNFLKQK